MKDFITAMMFVFWFTGLCMCIHGFIFSDVAESVAGAGIFIGMSNIVRENG